ncbi:hypothetical protein [Kitasatospora mediocidica]|uniref:hypothetical protein n=1 Tax=Kitasatospora mediocidica TaxID=58352 RepID=UPI0012FA23F3|nr:hypothetical protein [Kitasatospora mediocidica]
MIGMIALSEVLDFRSGDAGCYGRCQQCGRLSRLHDLPSVDGRVTAFDPQMTYCCDASYEVISTVREVLEIKRNDPDYADLVDSIRHHGIGFPVLIYGRAVRHGHHRIAAAVDLDLTEIPWTNDSSIGWEEDWPDDSVLDCSA